MSLKEHQASPEMMKFFKRLLDIKEFVKEKYKETNDEILKEILDKLDETIKTKEKSDE